MNINLAWDLSDPIPDEYPNEFILEIRVDGDLHWSGPDRDAHSLKLGQTIKFLVSGPSPRSVSVGQFNQREGSAHVWTWDIQTAEREGMRERK